MRRLHHSLAAFRDDIVLAEVLDDARAGVLRPVPAPTIEPRRQVPQLLAVAPERRPQRKLVAHVDAVRRVQYFEQRAPLPYYIHGAVPHENDAAVALAERVHLECVIGVTHCFCEAKSLGPESHVSNNPLTAYPRLLALKNDMREIYQFSTGFGGRSLAAFWGQEPPPGSHCPVAARICANSSAAVRISAISERCEPLHKPASSESIS